jgi:Flp pilus assembly protein TadB
MNPLVVLVALLAAGVAVTLTLAVVRSLQNPTRRASFNQALEVIAGSELQIDTALNASEKEPRNWSEYWLAATERTGRIFPDPRTPGRFAAGAVVFGAAFGVLVIPGGPVGIFVAFVPLIALNAFFGFERSKRTRTIEKQLPNLLSGLRANLQAGATPQQAIIAVSDDMPSPLGDEMRAVKSSLNVAVPIDQALRMLAVRVPSREMQFLSSSIEIAIRNGADLDPQLATIEEIVAQRTRIRQKLAGAVAQVKPTQYLAYAAVPGMLAYSILIAGNSAFWLGPGIIWLIVVAVLYALGWYALRFMVKSVENQ